jgi:murein L,D-transpeptidase YafK
MELKRDGRILKAYRVAWLRAKEREDDERTPEGKYTSDGRNPRSAFHLSLRASYPDAEESPCGRRAGGRAADH